MGDFANRIIYFVLQILIKNVQKGSGGPYLNLSLHIMSSIIPTQINTHRETINSHSLLYILLFCVTLLWPCDHALFLINVTQPKELSCKIYQTWILIVVVVYIIVSFAFLKLASKRKKTDVCMCKISSKSTTLLYYYCLLLINCLTERQFKMSHKTIW